MTAFAIFDIDGTLVDSRWMIQAAMERAFNAKGLTPPVYEQTRQIVGLTLSVAIDRLAPRDLGAEALAELTEGYKQAFMDMRMAGEESEPLYAGATELLADLKSSGWQIGIATGKSRRGLDAVMKRENWFDIFDCSFCADDGPGKPHPHMVNENLKALTAHPENAVMIGDTHFDMSMGKAAGVHAIGVDWGFHSFDEVKAGGADVMVSTMGELSAALSGFRAKIIS